MTQETRDQAPSAEEIEKRFRSLRVLAARPLVWAAIAGLRVTRRFGWESHDEYGLGRLEGPLVFAANHRSHCDTAAILDTLPPAVCRRTVVAAALDVFGPDSNGGTRRRMSKECLQFIVAAGFHAFAFDRLGPPLRSVRTSVHLIRNGWNLLLYPEGTRNRTGQIGPFKAGVGLLARFTERPVIPVYVSGGDDILPYGAFLPGAGRACVRYGAPLYYEVGDTPVTFAARLQEQVRLLGQHHAATVAAWPARIASPLRRPRKQPA